MRTRPQQNRRRGFLRAGITVIVLLILAIAVVLIANALTSNTAKAPTVPTPPKTVVVPTVPKTPGKSTPSAKPTSKATHTGMLVGKQHQGSHVVAAEESGRSIFARSRSVSLPPAAEVSPNGRYAAWIQQRGSAYAQNPLWITDLVSGRRSFAGWADPYILPVWSQNGDTVLFGRVASTHAFPHAQWTLLAYNVTHRTTSAIAHDNAANMTPLGWSHGHILYLVANTTDTSIYSVRNGRKSLVGILMPQVITSARLSPDGRYIAFAAPTNCATCTVDVYDLQNLSVWVGPTGASNETEFAWAYSGHELITALGIHLAELQPATRHLTLLPVPSNLPVTWPSDFRVAVSNHAVQLSDPVTGTVYRTHL